MFEELHMFFKCASFNKGLHIQCCKFKKWQKIKIKTEPPFNQFNTYRWPFCYFSHFCLCLARCRHIGARTNNEEITSKTRLVCNFFCICFKTTAISGAGSQLKYWSWLLIRVAKIHNHIIFRNRHIAVTFLRWWEIMKADYNVLFRAKTISLYNCHNIFVQANRDPF